MGGHGGHGDENGHEGDGWRIVRRSMRVWCMGLIGPTRTYTQVLVLVLMLVLRRG